MRIVNVKAGIKVIFILLFSFSFSVFGQSVRKQSKNINSRKYLGYSIKLYGPEDKITTFWEAYLDERSKIRKKRDFWQLEEFKIPDAYYPEAVYYVRILSKDSTVTLWTALDPETLLAGEEGEGLVGSALELFMGGVSQAFQRYEMELKISETEQAVSFQVRHQESLGQKNIKLRQQLEYSKEERIRMEKLLENLELKILATAQHIENNKIAIQQDSVDIIRMNKLLAQYKQELAEIE